MARDDPENYSCANEILCQQKPNSILTALVAHNSKSKKEKEGCGIAEKEKSRTDLTHIWLSAGRSLKFPKAVQLILWKTKN